jgi:hypothetical protein
MVHGAGVQRAHRADLERLVSCLGTRVAIALELLPQVVGLVARGVGVYDVVAFGSEGGVEKRGHLVSSQQSAVSSQQSAVSGKWWAVSGREGMVLRRGWRAVLLTQCFLPATYTTHSILPTHYSPRRR